MIHAAPQVRVPRCAPKSAACKLLLGCRNHQENNFLNAMTLPLLPRAFGFFVKSHLPTMLKLCDASQCTIDHQVSPGNENRRRAAQKHHRSGNLLQRSHASGRVQIHRRLQQRRITLLSFFRHAWDYLFPGETNTVWFSGGHCLAVFKLQIEEQAPAK